MYKLENRSKDSGRFVGLWELFQQIGKAETALEYEAAAYLVAGLDNDMTAVNYLRSQDESGLIVPLDMDARLRVLRDLRIFGSQGTLFDADGIPNDEAQRLFGRIGFYASDIYPFLFRHDVAVAKLDEADSEPRRFPDGRYVPNWIPAYDGLKWISEYRVVKILIAGTCDAELWPPALYDVHSKWEAALTDAVNRAEIATTTISGKQMLAHSDIRAWCEQHGYAWPLEAPSPEPAPVADDATYVHSGATPRPPQQQAYQEQEILNALKVLGHDPMKLPKAPAGQPGAKAEARRMLNWQGSRTFDKAWERLRRDKRIIDAR